MRADFLVETEADVETKAAYAGAGLLEDIARNVCYLGLLLCNVQMSFFSESDSQPSTKVRSKPSNERHDLFLCKFFLLLDCMLGGFSL